MDKKPSLTVIIPALNEEKNIQETITSTLKALGDYNIDSEIIVVNDGSTDRTEDKVNDIINKNSRVKLIRHDVPKGIGASFWVGVDNANGDVITWLPGDNENNPWEIFRYYKLLEHVDIVIPFIFNPEVRSPFRNILSFVYRFIINTTFFVNFNYTNGTALYRGSILRELNYRSDSFFFQTDILIRTIKKGYLFAEVPYQLGLRKGGRSKAISFPALLQVMKGYLHLVKDYYFSEKEGVGLRFSDDSLTTVRRHDEQSLNNPT